MARFLCRRLHYRGAETVTSHKDAIDGSALEDRMADKVVFATMNGVEGEGGVPGVSGGDVRLIQILQRLTTRAHVVLGTSPLGKKLCERYALDVDFRVIPVADRPGIFGNLARVLWCVTRVPRGGVDVAYSGGEHLYDVLPAAVLKVVRRTPWVAVVHWVEGYPWNDKRGGTPRLHRYLYWLNRVVALGLVRVFADRILAVSSITREKLIREKGFPPERIATVLCGLDLAAGVRSREYSGPKRYDAIFLKRLTYGKGILDLLDIWAQVTKARPGARLAIVGAGSEGVLSRLRERAADLGITDAVDFVGVVHDPVQKAELLAASRLFVLPSHEENWAIVIGEALAAGLPVFAYDLKEIVPIWGDRVSWIPFGDTAAFAAGILAALARPEREVPLDEFLRSLDWSAVAQKEIGYLARAVR
jgi:glycosyltransferase involved in cell wall biosynthesis